LTGCVASGKHGGVYAVSIKGLTEVGQIFLFEASKWRGLITCYMLHVLRLFFCYFKANEAAVIPADCDVISDAECGGGVF